MQEVKLVKYLTRRTSNNANEQPKQSSVLGLPSPDQAPAEPEVEVRSEREANADRNDNHCMGVFYFRYFTS